ncbi:hypothetical protein AB0J52_06740 [Spirillospora sp. NPDC049652]
MGAVDLLGVRYSSGVVVETQPAADTLVVWVPRAPMTVEWCQADRTAVLTGPDRGVAPGGDAVAAS